MKDNLDTNIRNGTKSNLDTIIRSSVITKKHAIPSPQAVSEMHHQSTHAQVNCHTHLQSSARFPDSPFLLVLLEGSYSRLHSSRRSRSSSPKGRRFILQACSAERRPGCGQLGNINIEIQFGESTILLPASECCMEAMGFSLKGRQRLVVISKLGSRTRELLNNIAGVKTCQYKNVSTHQKTFQNVR